MQNLMYYLKPGELVVISGETSHGKSALASQIAVENAKHYTSLIFSLEMTETEIVSRILCQKSGVNIEHLMESRLSQEENDKLDKVEDTER